MDRRILTPSLAGWLRPYALADRGLEPPVAGMCVIALLVVFLADISTPVQVALSALGLLPLLAAVWLLSGTWAVVVGVVAIGQLLASGFLGTLSPVTVASEATAYVVLAILCRLVANSFALALEPPRQTMRPNGGPPGLATNGLTRRELEVARLAAQGWTAREIGDRLHIGKRTVETHLANAYEKLGVRSKRELMHEGMPGVIPSPVDD